MRADGGFTEAIARTRDIVKGSPCIQNFEALFELLNIIWLRVNYC